MSQCCQCLCQRHLPACLTASVAGRCGFGVSRHVKHNVIHIDDRHILHPLGKHLANYDCSTSEVKASAGCSGKQTECCISFLIPLECAICRQVSCLLEMVFPRSGTWRSLQTRLMQQLCNLFLLITRSCRCVPELLVNVNVYSGCTAGQLLHVLFFVLK